MASRRMCSLVLFTVLLAAFAAFPRPTLAAVVANPLCPAETAFFAPGNGENIKVLPGYTVSVFASGLNAPTGIAFRGNKNKFEVFVLESGHGLPSVCNEQGSWPGGVFDPANPFTPDIVVFDQNANRIATLAKPTASGGGLQPAGPAVDIAFENGFQGGRLFATDSNQATHGGGQNSSSRIVIVDATTGTVTPFITGLPTGDHPTEQLAFKGGWIYWSQGSTTNSAVVGLDNNGGKNQPDIPCQDITLSQNVFPSSISPFVATSGYMPFGVQAKGAKVPAFTNTQTGQVREGVCTGATLRASLKNPNIIEAVGWGHRNGYAIRFAPDDHPLHGQLLVGEDGADERGARPSNGAPEVLSVDQQNADGTPVYHGWPDHYGFLAASQAVFNPVGGASDDLCVFDAGNPPSFCTPASLANILKFDVPVADVLAFPPAPIVAPLAIEAADSSFTGIDFVPRSFVGGPVLRGAALYSLEGDFGFSAPNATAPAPEVGHEVKLINFNQDESGPLSMSFENFARNDSGEQAFVSGTKLAGFNRPTNVRFGPDDCAYVVDYGVVRDPGGGPGGDTRFVNPADAPLVQIPGTGVIWKICRAQ
jgi:hypothetical protein